MNQTQFHLLDQTETLGTINEFREVVYGILNNKSKISRGIYQFHFLERVGDGFFMDDYKAAQSARVAGIQFVKRHDLPWKIGIRKVNGGWQVLRTA